MKTFSQSIRPRSCAKLLLNYPSLPLIVMTDKAHVVVDNAEIRFLKIYVIVRIKSRKLYIEILFWPWKCVCNRAHKMSVLDEQLAITTHTHIYIWTNCRITKVDSLCVDIGSQCTGLLHINGHNPRGSYLDCWDKSSIESWFRSQ